MYIKKKDIDVEDVLKGCVYLGAGASKEGYRDIERNVVIKVPRERCLVAAYQEEIEKIGFPDEMKELEDFCDKIGELDSRMVWPLGQFAIEIMIWRELERLENEGWDINGFARIKDIWMDANGVIIIEQEYIDDGVNDEGVNDFDAEEFEYQNEDILNELEDWGFLLRDFRSENMGVREDGTIVLFDYGCTSESPLDDWYSYSDDEYEYEDED